MEQKIWNEHLDRYLRSRSGELEVPAYMDKLIIGMSNREQPSARSHILKAAMVMAGVVFVFVSFLFFRSGKDASFRKDCLQVYSEIIRAAEEKDVDLALSLLSSNDLGMNEQVLKKNMDSFFSSVGEVEYVIRDIELITRGDQAVGKSRYFLSVSGNKGPVQKEGQDRIYFERKNGRVLITAWLNT